MKLKQLASNMTELELADGTIVLFSYETPVSCILPTGQYCRTLKKWSVTTSKHIGKWYNFRDYNAETRAEMPQEFFNNLVQGV
jgi:hypothetical protein